VRLHRSIVTRARAPRQAAGAEDGAGPKMVRQFVEFVTGAFRAARCCLERFRTAEPRSELL
jgi:hypothetical protein